MAFSPKVLNMRIAVFDFLREIMSPFDVKDARKRPHWLVRALLCCKSTNELWYLNSLLFRSGALYMSGHPFPFPVCVQCHLTDVLPLSACTLHVGCLPSQTTSPSGALGPPPPSDAAGQCKWSTCVCVWRGGGGGYTCCVDVMCLHNICV